jgi:transcriptional regulator with XRE-family HTH domain
MLTIEQCRAARGLLNWTQQDLADACGLSKTAINNFEKRHSDIKVESLRAIRLAFESADIEFTPQNGLRKREDSIEILKGEMAIDDLFEDILNSTKATESEILMTTDFAFFEKHNGAEKIKKLLDKKSNDIVSMRLINTPKAQDMLEHKNLHVRHMHEDIIKFTMNTVIYNGKLALILWDESMIIVIDSQIAGSTERRRFEMIWARAIKPEDISFLPSKQNA